MSQNDDSEPLSAAQGEAGLKAEAGQLIANMRGNGRSDDHLRMSAVTDLATDHPRSLFDRVLQWVPRILSSKPHIVFLTLLGIYLVLLPLVGIVVSAKAELIGGNYTNVTSDIGACIAAGGTLHLVNQNRKRQKLDAERLRLLKDMHDMLRRAHPDPLREPGQPAPSPAGEQPQR